MRKTFVKKAKNVDGQMSLQITSMADIFMIILVFLLKSYGSGAIDVTPSSDVMIPLAATNSGQAEGMKVEVGENTIKLNGDPVSVIKHYNFAQKDLARTGASNSLITAFRTKQQNTKGSHLIVLADHRAPYATIKTVLASAALTGYTDFKLAIVNSN